MVLLRRSKIHNSNHQGPAVCVLCVLWFAAKLAPPPPAGRSQISDFELWDTRDIAERVLRSVRDGSKPNAAIKSGPVGALSREILVFESSKISNYEIWWKVQKSTLGCSYLGNKLWEVWKRSICHSFGSILKLKVCLHLWSLGKKKQHFLLHWKLSLFLTQPKCAGNSRNKTHRLVTLVCTKNHQNPFTSLR